MHMKNMLPYNNDYQGSKVTSEKLSVLFCLAWSLPLYWKIMNKILRDKGLTLS